MKFLQSNVPTVKGSSHSTGNDRMVCLIAVREASKYSIRVKISYKRKISLFRNPYERLKGIRDGFFHSEGVGEALEFANPAKRFFQPS
jgi:hypothetical protein